MAEKVIFQPLSWSSSVTAGLREALGSDEDINYIKNEVKQGISQLWRVVGSGLLVTRVERGNNALVIVAGQGKNAARVWDVIPRIAKANGLGWVRVHSSRKAMIRILKKRGYKIMPFEQQYKFYLKVV